MKKQFLFILVLLITTWNLGCAKKADTGGYSGGGGFVAPNAKKLLKSSTHDLARMLRLASPEIFAKLPKGWNQNKLADIIENTRYEVDVEKKRENNDLLFDYGVDRSGPYIAALKPYFQLYASLAVTFYTEEELRKTKKDMYRQLLHEVVHHLGIGTKVGTDEEADQVALKILDALDRDKMYCGTTNTVGKNDLPPLGVGFQSSDSGHDFSFSATLVKDFWGGEQNYQWTIYRAYERGRLNISFRSTNYFLSESTTDKMSEQSADKLFDIFDGDHTPYTQNIDELDYHRGEYWNGNADDGNLTLKSKLTRYKVNNEIFSAHWSAESNRQYVSRSSQPFTIEGDETLELRMKGHTAEGTYKYKGTYLALNPDIKDRAIFELLKDQNKIADREEDCEMLQRTLKLESYHCGFRAYSKIAPEELDTAELVLIDPHLANEESMTLYKPVAMDSSFKVTCKRSFDVVQFPIAK
jgi:hypothetical protein